METSKIAYEGAHVREEAKTSSFWAAMEENRFGVICMVLMVTLIPAGFAGAFALSMGPVPFVMILSLAMSTLASVLGMVPMKVLFTISGITLLVAAVLIATGLVMGGGLFENF